MVKLIFGGLNINNKLCPTFTSIYLAQAKIQITFHPTFALNVQLYFFYSKLLYIPSTSRRIYNNHIIKKASNEYLMPVAGHERVKDL